MTTNCLTTKKYTVFTAALLLLLLLLLLYFILINMKLISCTFKKNHQQGKHNCLIMLTQYGLIVCDMCFIHLPPTTTIIVTVILSG